MDRPRTIIHILSALDGKIIGPFMRTEAVRAVSEEYGRIRTKYHADAWLYGTVTTKEFTGYRRPELPKGSRNRAAGMAEDYIARQNAPLYYVSVDALGEIGWESGTYRRSGRPDAHVIEVLTGQAPAAYLSYLRERGVSYILAGEESLDCPTASRKLYQLFGIRTMLICGGGTVNWTFIQQGAADELSLVLVPAADGEPESVTVFEQSPLLQKSSPVQFKLMDVVRLKGDGIHLTYAIQPGEEQEAPE